MTALLDQVQVRFIEEERLREADPDLASLVNVNTWDDYRALCQRTQRGGRPLASPHQTSGKAASEKIASTCAWCWPSISANRRSRSRSGPAA